MNEQLDNRKKRLAIELAVVMLLAWAPTVMTKAIRLSNGLSAASASPSYWFDVKYVGLTASELAIVAFVIFQLWTAGELKQLSFRIRPKTDVWIFIPLLVLLLAGLHVSFDSAVHGQYHFSLVPPLTAFTAGLATITAVSHTLLKVVVFIGYLLSRLSEILGSWLAALVIGTIIVAPVYGITTPLQVFAEAMELLIFGVIFLRTRRLGTVLALQLISMLGTAVIVGYGLSLRYS